jgi:hypothetical protein
VKLERKIFFILAVLKCVLNMAYPVVIGEEGEMKGIYSAKQKIIKL